MTRSSRSRTPDLVRALADSPTGELTRAHLGRALDLSSTRSITGWINQAAEAGLVEATTVSAYSPNRAYRLTAGGRAVAPQLAAAG